MEIRKCAREECQASMNPKLHLNMLYCGAICARLAALDKRREVRRARRKKPEQWLAENEELLRRAESLILSIAPREANGFYVVIQIGESSYRFPEPAPQPKRGKSHRKRWDNKITSLPYFQLRPYEHPRVPISGRYKFIYVTDCLAELPPDRPAPSSFIHRPRAKKPETAPADGVRRKPNLPRLIIEQVIDLPANPMVWRLKKANPTKPLDS